VHTNQYTGEMWLKIYGRLFHLPNHIVSTTLFLKLLGRKRHIDQCKYFVNFTRWSDQPVARRGTRLIFVTMQQANIESS